MLKIPVPRFRPFSWLATHRRVRLGLAAAIIVFSLYSVFGFLVLPYIIRSQIENAASDKLQRTATVDAVKVNPFAWTIAMQGMKLMAQDGKSVFASIEDIHLNLSSESLVHLAPVIETLRVSTPTVHLARTDAHRYNFDDILEALARQPASEEPARFAINNIRIERGRIEFEDRPAKAKHVVADLQLGVPFISSLPSHVQIHVEPLISATINNTPVRIEGKARPFAIPRDAVIDLRLDDLDLTRFIEYLPVKPNIKVPSARLQVNLSASFVQPEGKPAALVLNGSTVLKSLQITEPDGKPVLKLQELKVDLLDASVLGNRFDIARVALRGAQAEARRGPDGKASWQRLMPAAAASPATSTRKATSRQAGTQVSIDEVDIQDVSLRYSDAQPSRPMQAEVDKFNVSVRKVSIDTEKKLVSVAEVRSDSANVLMRLDKATKAAATTQTAQANPARTPEDKALTITTPRPEKNYAVTIGRVRIDNWSTRLEDRNHAEPAVTSVSPLALSLQGISTATDAAPAQIDVKAGVNKGGQLSASGKIGFMPFVSTLAIDLKAVDLLPVQRYVTDRINLRLTRANLTTSGKLQLSTRKDGALAGGYQGDATIANLATVDKLSGNEFLRWKSLAVGGMDVQLAPFSFKANQVALNDFFARVIIDPSGRINLQDIVRGDAEAQPSLTVSRTTKPAVSGTTAAQTADQKPKTAPPPIAIGKLTLQGGRVRFTDNFIRPNYTATLSSLGGTVTDLSSNNAAGARVDLRGEVSNAPLSVTGRINPLRGDLLLDIQANVRGMELAPLSAYSGRHIGYGIEKGKLSFEVAYKVEARQLTAHNRLILEQLTFGDKVDSPSATKLPVQFAVALLRDRNGVIDVNLPIGGSLDDPQFSIGAILVKVIGNVILKAVTQPFALLGAAFGGGEQLSAMDFEPGRALISGSAEEKLKSLAKALNERPGLKLDIAGRVDPDSDTPALKKVSVERKVRSLKARDLATRGETANPGSVVVQPGEYRDLLTRAYRDENFAKPRNVLGLPKSLSTEEMEQLMIANAEIDNDDLLALGNQRAQAAKNWLQKTGQVPAERIFIVAPKIGGERKGSRADFSLR
ncbi:DUF748 domain-containing protein [Noviherbaspirillum saxi]|nr:DUF748 domain-containing protein [Noviherbaspirillum saxi]